MSASKSGVRGNANAHSATRQLRRMPVPGLLATVLVVVALASGCGKDQATSGPANSLKITVSASEEAAPKTMTLTCGPAGGSHPDAAAACSTLEKAGASVFEPVPKDQACTMIFGGPQTATVTGTYLDQEIDAAFSRSNGCEIDRWDTLGTTFFDLPLQ